VDSYGTLIDEKFVAETEGHKPPPAEPTAKQQKQADLEAALKADTRRQAERPEIEPPPPTQFSASDIVIVIAFTLFLVFVFRRIVAALDGRVNAWANSSPAAAMIEEEITATERALSEFVTQFQSGPAGVTAAASLAAKTFVNRAPKLIADLRA